MTPETPLQTTLETVSPAISAPFKGNPALSTPRLQQTPLRRRLPRFARAKRSHRPPLVLQDRDVELLRAVGEFRLISTPQILHLFSEESRDGIYRRLQGLYHHAYLDRLGRNPNAPLVYGLARRGAEVLGTSLPKAVGDRYAEHQLMVGDFRVALTLAARDSGIAVSWRRVPGDFPVKPDGFFTLTFPGLPEGGNRAHFFLEADRSTMTRERFMAKLAAYWDCHRRGVHTAALEIRTFRVLTVTKSEARVRSLVEAAARTPALASSLGHWWFAGEKHLATDGYSSIFRAVWETPAAPGRLHSLLPSTQPLGG